MRSLVSSRRSSRVLSCRPRASHAAEGAGLIAVDRCRGNSQVSSGLFVLLQHSSVVHAVELVTAKDQEILVGALQEIAEILTNRVGSSLIPVVVAGCLLGGKDMDEILAKMVKLVGIRHMPVERLAVKLG